MALNGLLDIELGVPRPQELADFWQRHGLLQTAAGVLGTADRPTQIRLVERDYRHLTELHLSCEAEEDLAGIASRLQELGVPSESGQGGLTCVDPVFGHRVRVDVGSPSPLSTVAPRVANPPGERNRTGRRAEVVFEETHRPPRRLGHIVLGTPRLEEAVKFHIDGLGYRVSDQILKGLATFARVENDHHNLLIHPGPTSYLNHYALEMDDVDAIGAAGAAVVAERSDASVVGVGRHTLGSNIFWYLTDPSGNMFEFFSDMDQILDDEAWAREHARLDWEGSDGPAGFAAWGPKEPEIFFNPPDLAEIGAARQAAGLE